MEIKTPPKIQYFDMAPGLSGQICIFGGVFFVSKSLLRIEGPKELEKFAILIRKARSHASILIYRTWPSVHIAFFTFCHGLRQGFANKCAINFKGYFSSQFICLKLL